MPRRPGQAAQRFWRNVLPSRAATCPRRHTVFRAANFLDCQARHPPNRNVGAGLLLFGSETLAPRRIHFSYNWPPSASAGWPGRKGGRTEMRTFLLGFVAAFVVLPLVALGYFRLGLAAVQSDATPPGWESALMRSAVHASVRRSAAAIQSPPQD